MAESTQVLVVGAGPVGLFLAGELRLHGVEVTVAERRAAPIEESRASQLNARTMEILHQRGLLDEFGDLVHETTGHFGGITFDATDVNSDHAGNWKVPQPRTEAVLGDRAVRSGAVLRREHELISIDVGFDAVIAEFSTPSGSAVINADYVVGCDGRDSTVRRLAGFGSTANAAAKELLRADVSGIDVPDRRFERLEHGVAVAARRGDGVTRIMVHEFDRPAVGRGDVVDFAELAQVWAKVTDEDITAGAPLWVDAFDDGTQHVDEYRRGRILLAGDAAHVHMPVAGQSLNVGLQDASNLGWKLAAQVAGWAPASLLDTYHSERHSVGKRVLNNVRAQTQLLLGGPEVTAMRGVLVELMTLPRAREHIARMVSGLDVRYECGGAGPDLLGARLPELELMTADGPTSASALLRGGCGVLLDLSGDPVRGERLRALARPWSDRVRVVSGAATSEQVLGGDVAFLVRPDGHVTWTGRADRSLRKVLGEWFGEIR